MKWVIFRNNLDYIHFMFNSETNPEVEFEKDVNNKFLYKICNLHRSVKLNRKINMPLKSIWYKYYLDYDALKTTDEIIFIFFEGSQLSIDSGFLRFLKKKYPNSKFVYRYFNTITDYNKWSKTIVTKNYDLIVSMDISDCSENGWIYVPNTYPINYDITKLNSLEYKSDVFFIGREKGRLDEIIKVYDYLNSRGIKCVFIISGLTNNEVLADRKGIKSIDYLPYSEVLKYVSSTRCLLEITQKNQHGSTLRALEAISFDKRFISNDCSLIQNDYYDSEYMNIFNDVEDISIDFIMSEKKVLYSNKEAISNRKLMNAIFNELNGKEKKYD